MGYALGTGGQSSAMRRGASGGIIQISADGVEASEGGEVIQLRPYQVEGLEAITKSVDQGLRRVLLQMCTGGGKTVLFAALLERLSGWLAQWPKRGAVMLVIAHREELLDQAADKIRRQNPGLMVDIEQGERRASRYSDVVIASIQTLSARRYARLENLLRWHTPRLVVVDEAHHAAAATYRTVLARLGFLPLADVSESTETEAATFDDVKLMAQALEGWDQEAPKDRLLLGVTATPNRSDAIGLGCVFQTIAYSYGIKPAIDDGFLVPIEPWVIETAESLDAVRITHGEFNQKDLAETVNTEHRNELAVASWRQYAPDESTLAFTVDVQHAHDLAATFRRQGVTAQALSGETPKDERRGMLADYTAGRLQVICNCMVLTEGTDLPRTGAILHAKPTKSATLYEQMTGRGLRIHPGKTRCVVLDLVDIARKHSLQTAAMLFGLPPGLKTKGDDLRKTAAELDELRAKYATFDIEGLLAAGRFSVQEIIDRASTFDIWKIPDLGIMGEGLAFGWIQVSPDVYRLQYPWADGIEILQVSKDLLDKWEIVSTLRPTVKPGEAPKPARQRTEAVGLPSGRAALVMAEAFVSSKRGSVAKLKQRDAHWRGDLASEKQLDLLRRWRVPFNVLTLTKGQASDLLDLAAARRGK